VSDLDPDLEQRVRAALQRTADGFVVGDVTWLGPTDPRAEHRRHGVSRAIGFAGVAALMAVSLVIGAGAVVLMSRGHSGQLTPREAGGGVLDRATLQMPRGKTTRVVRLRKVPPSGVAPNGALAPVPYTVVVRTPASAQVTVYMDVDKTHVEWNTTNCVWRAGLSTCRYHCDGGPPFGRNWSLVVTKTSIPAVRVSIRVTLGRLLT